MQWNLVGQDGVALAAADPNGLLVAFVPTASADTDVSGSLLDTFGTGVGEIDWARSITSTLTDADATITSAKIYLTGYNRANVLIQETLTHAVAGVVESNYAFWIITSVIYHVDGVVTPAIDTLELGWGDKLGLPTSISVATEIRTKRADAVIDAGTIDIAFQTWEPTGGNVPNAAKQFYFETY